MNPDAAPFVPAPATAGTRVCAGCKDALPRADFSKNQWSKKKDGQFVSRCMKCVGACTGEASGRNDSGAIPSSLLRFEEMRASLQEKMVTSLGDGYDEKSLQLLDRKMCDYFLDEDALCYDFGRNERSAHPVKPTGEEIEHYQKSTIIRKDCLRKTHGIQAMNYWLGGEGHKNLQLYQDFYDDLRTHHYAWFEIIFKNDTGDLHMACKALVKLASVKLEMGVKVDDIHEIIEILREVKHLFQDTVQEHDKESCEYAGDLEYDLYELIYKTSIELAKAGKRDEAEEYFEDALTMENIWGYHDDMHCTKLLFFATGERISFGDSLMYEPPYGGFYYECLQAHLQRRQGSVPGFGQVLDEECCDNCGKPAGLLQIETGKKLKNCTRCQNAKYCNRDCQIADWKAGHKKVCGKR